MVGGGGGGQLFHIMHSYIYKLHVYIIIATLYVVRNSIVSFTGVVLLRSTFK